MLFTVPRIVDPCCVFPMIKKFHFDSSIFTNALTTVFVFTLLVMTSTAGRAANLSFWAPANDLISNSVLFGGGLSANLLGPAFAPCDGPFANEIVEENCKTGNPSSEWDISGAGDASIQGFATDISVNRGGTINFKVDTTATSFQIKIYRLGYYNGDGARLIATIPDTATTATSQPACANSGSPDYLVDCGGWSVSGSWTATDNTYSPAKSAVSGLYIARLESTDGSDLASHIPFVVRDDTSGSGLLFKTSDTTWQAYNQYGGYSLYAGPGPQNGGHAHKVSFNRPITTRDTPVEDNLFNAEYPMIRWIERNGYDVSYLSSVDADRIGHRTYRAYGCVVGWTRRILVCR